MAAKSKREKLVEDRNWPEDVIQEILVRLPIKLILRLRSTCKSWNSLLRSRSFVDFHRRFRHDKPQHMDELFFRATGPYTDLPYSYTTDLDGPYRPYVVSSLSSSSSSLKEPTPLFDFGILRRALSGKKVEPPLVKTTKGNVSGIRVIGPLDFGVCCVIAQELVVNLITDETFGYYKVALCNLATREFNVLPHQHPCSTNEMRRTRKDHFGFGSIRTLQAVDYKIIAIHCIQQIDDEQNQKFRASVYSLKHGSWKVICDSNNLKRYSPNVVVGLADKNGKVQFPTITQDFDRLPVQAFLNGSCHWMALLPVHQRTLKQAYCVLQFDMTNEAFGLIAPPPHQDTFRKNGVFVLGDHLAAVLLPNWGGSQAIDVWMMMEYGDEKSWTKIHSCDTRGYIHRILGMSFSGADEDNHNCGLNIDRIFFQDSHDNLCSCDRFTIERYRQTFGKHWTCWKPLGLSAYVETLEPVSTTNDEGIF